MILQALVEHYEALAKRGEISKPGWCTEKVSFALDISLEGELLGILPLVQLVQRGKKEAEVPQSLNVPERVVRSSGVKANFLCDNASYFLGFDSSNSKRAVECFEAAKELHLSILNDSKGIYANAVKEFFATWNPANAENNSVLEPYKDKLSGVNFVFMIDGENYAHLDEETQVLWEEYSNKSSDAEKVHCLVSGKEDNIVRLHGKIKGIQGAQSAGANLVSINANAYESYDIGTDKMPNAPVGEYAAFAYVTTINHLIAERDYKQTIGDTTVVYWSEKAEPKPKQMFSLFAVSDSPNQDGILKGVMDNLAKGLPIDDVDITQKFYIMGLAPNAARVSIRFFLQSTFGTVLDNLRNHYLRLEIVRPSYDMREYLSIPMLLAETVNPNSKNKSASPLLAGTVFQSIIKGTPYPYSFYHAVISRIRAGDKVSRGRAAIIKAYLCQHLSEEYKEVLTVALNTEASNTAYVLGRLFAVLEDIQQQANPGINSTIKDRFFTSACSTPAVVFPRLLQLSNHHIAKLEYSVKMKKEIGDILDKLDFSENPFPVNLSLNEQGIFILGYYHQTQFRYKKKEEI